MNLQTLAVEIADLRRRFDNVARVGVIAETDYAKARVRVAIGALKTTWLPWLTHRAGGDTVWHAPEVGEQVLVVSPSGDLAQGLVLPAIFYASHPANAAAATVHRTTYADGAVIEYDRSAHELKLTIPGKVTLNTTGNVSATIGGNLAATVTGTTGVTSTGAVSVTSSAGITLTGTSITLDAPVVNATGNVVAIGNLADLAGAQGTLAVLRTKYNAHTHPPSAGTDNPVP